MPEKKRVNTGIQLPPGNTSKAKPKPPPAPEPDFSKWGDRGTSRSSAIMMDPRDAEMRRAKEAIDHILNPAPTIDLAPGGRTQHFSPQGFQPDMAQVGAGMGVGPGMSASEVFARGLTSQPSEPYREDQGPRRFAVPQRPQNTASSAFARGLGVSETGYSPGVLATRERQRAMAQADSLGLPPQVRDAMQMRIQKGDTQVVNRAAELLAGMENPAVLQDRRASSIFAQELLGGGGAQGYDQKKQADHERYAAAARRNTELAQGNSKAARDLGMDPLTSSDKIRAEQDKRKRTAYQQSSRAELEKLAAQGDVQAAEALRGGTMPGFTGPVQGVRDREAAAAKQTLDEAAQRQEQALRIRYEIPARIEQETAQIREQGLDRRAWLKKDPKTGNTKTFSYDQLLRTYQTALKAHEHANGEIDSFPTFFDWADHQGFSVAGGVQESQPATASSFWDKAMGAMGLGRGGGGGQAPMGGAPTGGSGGAGYPPPAGLTPQEQAQWMKATPEQQMRYMQKHGLAP